MSRLTSTLALGALLGGCGSDIPGDALGAYAVTMRLTTNSCGAAVVPFPDGQQFSVEIRREGERGYWHIAREAPVSGTYGDAGFRFTFQQSIELGTMDAGTLGCTVLREEELIGVLDGLIWLPDGGVDARTDGGALRGDHRVGFRANPSGRCRDEHGPLREFALLPCEARYRLDGVPRKPF